MPDAAGLELEGRFPVGRDPRAMTRAELIELGHEPMSPLKALRLRCLDCCCDQPSEVRTAVKCPSWPFRMGVNPWRAPASEARREHARTLAAKRAAGAENQHTGSCPGDAPPPAGTWGRAAGFEEEFEDAAE
jgi:hypothetical protein